MLTMDKPPATSMVSLTIDGPRANLTLTRPDKFNAMNVEMIQELILLLEWTAERSAGRLDALHDEAGQPYLRTLVLRGEGKHFCAGADINMMRDAGANTPEENRADSERLSDAPPQVVCCLSPRAQGGGFRVAPGSRVRV